MEESNVSDKTRGYEPSSNQDIHYTVRKYLTKRKKNMKKIRKKSGDHKVVESTDENDKQE
jgi:hypothetical protein